MTSSHVDQFDHISEEFVARLRRGEQPSLDEYVEQYPHLAADISRLFPTLAVMEKVGSGASSRSGNLGSTLTAWPMPPAEDMPLPERIDGYRVLREIGYGGMGVVYEAVQETLGRHVAIKVLPFRGGTRRKYLERFLRESQSAARLSHPHIVPVFDVGESDGMHYYVMQFIAGRGLDQVIAVRESGTIPTLSQSDWKGVAQLGARVADALEHAHSEGVIHRDIKPSNLLLDDRGHVWVTDFGLAKSEDADGLTEQGDILGTLGYMPPERFNGWSDARSDVYSLGVTLYELAAGRPPFTEKNRGKLIRQITNDEPPRARKLNRAIPPDLETIVHKAMAKEPGHRYATAKALADDLRRFIDGRPIEARRATWAGHLRRWTRRNPWPAGVAASLLLILVVLPFVASAVALRFRANLQRAERAEADVIGERNEIKRLLDREREVERETAEKLRVALLAKSRGERQLGSIGRRQTGLDAMAEATRRQPDNPLSPAQRLELRNEAINNLIVTDLRPVPEWSLTLPPGVGVRACFDRHLEYYAISNGKGTVTVYSWRDRSEQARLTGLRFVVWMKFSPDGRYLITRDLGTPAMYAAVHVWDWRAGKKIVEEVVPGEGEPFDFHPESNRVALGLADKSVRICDLPSGSQVASFTLPSALAMLSWRSDGKSLAVGTRNSAVELRDPTTGALQSRIQCPADVNSLEWSPEGQLLFTGCVNHRGYLWDVATGQMRAELVGHQGRGIAGRFLASALVTGSYDGTLRLWDARSGKQLGFVSGGSPLQVSADGRRLVELSNQRVRLFELAGDAEWRTLECPARGASPPNGPHHVGFSPDGRIIVTSAPDGTCLFDARSGDVLAHLPEWSTTSFFTADGSRLLISGPKGMFSRSVRSDQTGRTRYIDKPRQLTAAVSGHHQRMTLSKDGGIAGLAIQGPGLVRVYQMTPEPKQVLADEMIGASTGLVSPDGRWLVVMCWSNPDLRIWDLATKKVVKDLRLDSWAQCAFSADGQWLAIATTTDTRLLQVGDWEPGPRFPEHLLGGRHFITFSPDGHTVACVTADRHIHVLDAKSLTEFAVLQSPSPQPYTYAAFSPDGSTFAVACASRQVQVWDLRRIRQQLTEIGLDWESPAYPVAVPFEPLRIEVRNAGEKSGNALPRPTDSNNSEVIFLATNRLISNPLDADALYHRGWALLNLNRLPAALADLSIAITLNPGLFDAYHQRGHVLDRLNRRADAIPDFTKALADSNVAPTERAHLHSVRGLDRWALRKFDAALADFDEAHRLNPQHARYLCFIAWWHGFAPTDMRSPANALPFAERAARLALDDPMNHLSLGALLVRLDRFDEATPVLERALEVGRGRMDGYALFLLAMCHHHANKPAEARDCLDRAERWMSGRPRANASPLDADLKAVRGEARLGARCTLTWRHVADLPVQATYLLGL